MRDLKKMLDAYSKGCYSKEFYANRDIAYYKLRNYSGLFRISWNSLGSVNGR